LVTVRVPEGEEVGKVKEEVVEEDTIQKAEGLALKVTAFASDAGIGYRSSRASPAKK